MEGALMSDDPHEKEVLYGHAIDIYKAPFLHTVNLDWVEARRKQLQMMYAEALIGMAYLQVAKRLWDRALGYFARALREVPQREDIHRQAMQMYINMGRLDDARNQYAILERLLKRKLAVAPSMETRELMRSIDR